MSDGLGPDVAQRVQRPPRPGVSMGTGVGVVKAWHWVSPLGLGHG